VSTSCRMRISGATILFILMSLSVLAQNDINVSASPQPQTAYDSVRSKYIKSYPDHFFLWPVIKQRKLDFDIQRISDRKDAVDFKSNKPFSLGIGMYLFELGIEIAFAVPLNEQSKAIYGESDARDIQVNAFGKRWGADAYYQKYNGFYIDDETTDIAANTPYPQRPDIETRNVGITGTYVINSKKFSYRSAYNFAERQLKSAGTFVIFASLNSFNASADSSLLGTPYESRFGQDSFIREIKFNTLGVAPGYSYNLIYKGFFLNGTLAFGPGLNRIAYTRNDQTNRSTKIDAFATLRISMGYNGDQFFGGLTFVTQARTAKFEEVMLSSSNTSFKILFGYRFREFGFLKKRIWDLPKGLF
jgi:hypothetical protein